MPSWRVSRKASLSNQITHFGIMGGLSNSRVATHTNRATNTLRIPKPAAAGLQFMRMHNLLSKNPQGSGGVGRMVKTQPCNCTGVVKKTEISLEENNLGEDTLGDNSPKVSCTPCNNASNNFGCSFKSQHNNYYCCPSGNYYDSGCSTSEHVCYINEPDNSGCLEKRFSHCPSGACEWDGTGNIADVFSSCDTVIITKDISDISNLLTVPKDKTLISYGKLSFSTIPVGDWGIKIDGSATFNETVSFNDISGVGGAYCIWINGSGTFQDVSFGDITGLWGIEINGSGTFQNVSFSDINGGGPGIAIYSPGLGTFQDVNFNGIVEGATGIQIFAQGTGTFQDVSFSDISNDGDGILASPGDISYNTICGYPSSNVWPSAGARDHYNKDSCFSRTQI